MDSSEVPRTITDAGTSGLLVAARDGNSWLEVAELIRGDGANGDPELAALAGAFEYTLPIKRRERGAAAFQPMVVFEGGLEYPPPLADLPPNIPPLWSSAADAADAAGEAAPVAQARLHDLLFELRHGRVGDHATRAIDSYLAVAMSKRWSRLDRARCLIRALELTQLTKRDSDSQRVAQAMLDAAAISIEQVKPEPGVAVSLLEALIAAGADRGEIDELLVRARAAYPDPYLAGNVIALQRRRAAGNAEGERALDRELAEIWLDEAEAVTGFHRVHNLETALQIARDRGQPDLAERAASLLQETNIEDLGLQRFESELTLPADVFDAEVAAIVGDGEICGAIDRYAHSPCPTGDPDHNLEFVAKMAVEAPLQAMIPKTRIGGDGLPRYTPQTDEERRESSLADVEVFRLRFFSTVAVAALERLLQDGLPDRDRLTAFWAERSHVPDDLARSLTEAFRLFGAGEFEAAGYVIAPKIETLARNLVLQTGRGIYRAQRQSQQAQYPGLGFLIAELREVDLPQSHCRYLSTFLTHPAGMNYRNELLHGFVPRIFPGDAALLLHAAAFLARLELTEQPTT